MNPLIVILIIIAVSLFFLPILFLTAKPYPIKWEEEENKELKIKFDKYKKSQEI